MSRDSKEAKHRYYLRNRERILVQTAEWAKNNPESRRAASRRYMAKVRRRDGDVKKQNRAWLAGIKVDRGCEFVLPDGSLCGWNEHPAALEFNHRDPLAKGFAISQATGSRSREAILAEVAKCDVLCSNHHRIVTATGGHYTAWRRRGAIESPQLALFEESA